LIGLSAYSPDRKHVISRSDCLSVGCQDFMALSPVLSHVIQARSRTVRVCDVEAGEIASGPFTGHTSRVQYSRTITGSSNETICVKDIETCLSNLSLAYSTDRNQVCPVPVIPYLTNRHLVTLESIEGPNMFSLVVMNTRMARLIR
jgi:hypothetical protein